MKHRKLQLLFCSAAMLFLSSCFDSKPDQNIEERVLPEEQYDFSTEDNDHEEENADVDFKSPAEVMSYLSDKNFKSPDGSKVVHIGYDGVSINGTPAYFNLDITVGGSTTAFIKGQSLNNPNGVINIRVDGDRDCIYNDGTSFCL